LHLPYGGGRMYTSPALMISHAPLHGRYPLAAQQISWWSSAPRRATSRPTAQAAASLCGVPQPSSRGEHSKHPVAACLHMEKDQETHRPTCLALCCINCNLQAACMPSRGVGAVAWGATAGALYVAGADRQLVRLNPADGSVISRFEAGHHPLAALAVTADGARAFAASTAVTAWDPAEQRRLFKYTGHPVS
jgi:hypothetical protein